MTGVCQRIQKLVIENEVDFAWEGVKIPGREVEKSWKTFRKVVVSDLH